MYFNVDLAITSMSYNNTLKQKPKLFGEAILNLLKSLWNNM